MSKLIGIGEALIDFIPHQSGVELKDVGSFQRVAGGAPANVCACLSKLGHSALMLTQLGMDAFGDHIIEVLQEAKVDTSAIQRTHQANTGLAFVSLQQDGNREFSFYRNPSADMLLGPEDIDETLIQAGDILHFCSVDLVDYPIRKAHDKAMYWTRKRGGIVSFDPNVRLPLWEDHRIYKQVINDYIPQADILKVSDEELEFITGKTEADGGIHDLFRGHVQVVLYTKGRKGASVHTKHGTVHHDGFVVDAIDTTGAGDSFMGAFLYQLLTNKVSVATLSTQDYSSYVRFANAVGALVASRPGAIPSMPRLREVQEFLASQQ